MSATFAAFLQTTRHDQFVVGIDTNNLIGWIVIGLIAGWLAGKISRGAGFGCLTDIILGMVGSLLGGWIFTKMGLFGGGFLYSLAAATVGAVILVMIAHLFSSGGRH